MGIVAQEAEIVASFAESLHELLVQAASGELSGDELLGSVGSLAERTARSVTLAASEVAASHEAAPVCEECGGRMVRHDRQARPLVTRFGEVRYWTQRWRCRSCGTSACPSLEGLDGRHQCTREVWETAVLLCAWLPFEVAERFLRRLGVCLSDNTLQRLTHEVGGERMAQRELEAAEVMGFRRTLHGERSPERLYVMVDGFSARVGDRWREPRVGVVFETAGDVTEDGEAPAAERVSLVTTLGEADEIAALLTAETQRRGIGSASEVVLVADGGNWIWERLSSLVPVGTKVVEILDWYHACENLWKAVTAVYGEGGNEVEYERLKRWLWVGRTSEVLDRLEALSERVSGEARKAVCNVGEYLREHRGRLNYQARQLAGYHVGSGQVESACKRLGKRVRGGGQTWSEDGLKAVLCLLADELTDPQVRRQAA